MIKKIMHATLTSVIHKKWLLFKTLLPHVILLVILDFFTKAYVPLIVAKQATSAELFYGVSALLLTFVVSVNIAVKTHRVLLLNEDGLQGLEFTKFQSREFSFLFKSILLGIMVGIMIVIFTLVCQLVGIPPFIGIIIGLFIALIVLSRLSIILPAIAVDNKISFKEAWNLTKEFKWLSFYIIILFPTLFCFIVSLVYGIVIYFLSHLLAMNLDVLYVFLNVFMSVFIISALSVMYSHIYTKQMIVKTIGV